MNDAMLKIAIKAWIEIAEENRNFYQKQAGRADGASEAARMWAVRDYYEGQIQAYRVVLNWLE